MQIKIKKLLPEAIIPIYAKNGDAGLDLTATSISFENTGSIEYGTGLSIEIPEGYVGLVYPRSSISKYGLFLANSVGVIDSGYRGEIKLRFKDDNVLRLCYEVGDRVGQLIIMPYPQVEFIEGDLTETDRGAGGFGSTTKDK